MFGFDFWDFVSAVFGWVYTICWSLSFYSQPLLNYRRKSTAGTTVDFPFLNTFGFLAYLTYTTAMYASPTIRHEYALRNKGLTPTVAANDVAFAAHAALLCIITTSQYFLPGVWGFEHAPGRKPSQAVIAMFAGCCLALGAVVFLVISHGGGDDPKRGWAWLDVLYGVSYVKLLVTLVKYAPQLLYNYRNASTKGWSISQILLDVAGSVLSIAQQAIDSWQQGDWSGITGNPVKFALGNVSLLYDAFFVMQHFVWYRDNNARMKDPERQGLLERSENDERRLD